MLRATVCPFAQTACLWPVSTRSDSAKNVYLLAAAGSMRGGAVLDVRNGGRLFACLVPDHEAPAPAALWLSMLAERTIGSMAWSSDRGESSLSAPDGGVHTWSPMLEMAIWAAHDEQVISGKKTPVSMVVLVHVCVLCRS